MKTNKIVVQLKNGNAVLREIELSPDDGEYIMEALKFYAMSAESMVVELTDRNYLRLRDQAFYLKSDLKDILDKLK